MINWSQHTHCNQLQYPIYKGRSIFISLPPARFTNSICGRWCAVAGGMMLFTLNSEITGVTALFMSDSNLASPRSNANENVIVACVWLTHYFVDHPNRKGILGVPSYLGICLKSSQRHRQRHKLCMTIGYNLRSGKCGSSSQCQSWSG
jgi:hypothetical protein